MAPQLAQLQRAASLFESSLVRSISHYAASTSAKGATSECRELYFSLDYRSFSASSTTEPSFINSEGFKSGAGTVCHPDGQSQSGRSLPLAPSGKDSKDVSSLGQYKADSNKARWAKLNGCIPSAVQSVLSLTTSSMKPAYSHRTSLPQTETSLPQHSLRQHRSFSAHAHRVRTSAVAPNVLGWRPSLADLEREDRKRRARPAGPSHRALLVDAAGTLLAPSEPAAQVYKDLGRKYGVTLSEDDILQRYRWAYSQPWSESHLRYVDDARLFWSSVIEASTGCSDPQYCEDLYQYYASAHAWKLIDPHAGEAFAALREAGVKTAVVSNFDTRLRPILEQLGCSDWFDALAVSAEVQAEKPNPTIFLHACEQLGVPPENAVHVGDDRRNDLWGARDAGCDAWLWGYDVITFAEVAERMGVTVAEAEEPLVA